MNCRTNVPTRHCCFLSKEKNTFQASGFLNFEKKYLNIEEQLFFLKILLFGDDNGKGELESPGAGAAV